MPIYIQQLIVFLFTCLSGSDAFAPVSRTAPNGSSRSPSRESKFENVFLCFSADPNPHDPSEIVAKRIIVTGDVQGGYYRSCVRNEAGRFRKLVGTMTPPDDSDRAEIYVEGKRKMVDGFVRWCKKGDVGLSQVIKVAEILDEDPTGLYDEFYVKTK